MKKKSTPAKRKTSKGGLQTLKFLVKKQGKVVLDLGTLTKISQIEPLAVSAASTSGDGFTPLGLDVSDGLMPGYGIDGGGD